MVKLSSEERDKAGVIIGIAIGAFGSVAYQAAENVAKLGGWLWVGFIVEYAVFIIVGIWVSLKLIKRAYTEQKAIKKSVVDAKKENLQLHFLELKISFDVNKHQIRKNPSLEEHYWSIISKIESGCDEILANEKIKTESNKEEKE